MTHLAVRMALSHPSLPFLLWGLGVLVSQLALEALKNIHIQHMSDHATDREKEVIIWKGAWWNTLPTLSSQFLSGPCFLFQYKEWEEVEEQWGQVGGKRWAAPADLLPEATSSVGLIEEPAPRGLACWIEEAEYL